MEQENKKGKSKLDTYLKNLREKLIKKLGNHLDSLVSRGVLNAYKVKRDFGMGDSTFNNLCRCNSTASPDTLDKMAFLIAYYLDQYDKELKAEPNGKEKKEKIDALSEMKDEFKLLYGCRADIAIKMVNEQSELLTN